MFTHLIESGSHQKDMARRGRFLLGTLGFYGLLLMVAGVASVYAYDTRLDTRNLELYTLVMPVSVAAQPEQPYEQPHPASGNHDIEVPQRINAIAPLLSNVQPPPTVSTVRNTSAEILTNRPFVISNRDVDPIGGAGPIGPHTGNYAPDANRRAVVVAIDPSDDIPPPQPTPTPARVPIKVALTSSIIASKIISKPAPLYPPLAKQAHVQGAVAVEILVDEQGRVISAHATGGHPLLRAAAQQSAYQARFSPTTLAGQPVKVSGVITYNFVLQ